MDGSIKQSSKSVIRITVGNGYNQTLLGTIKLNNMIPVPIFEIIPYDLDGEMDLKYKNLVINEMIWIQKNTDNILNRAKKLYIAKMYEHNRRNEKNYKFYDSIMPFKEAEEKCKLFNPVTV